MGDKVIRRYFAVRDGATVRAATEVMERLRALRAEAQAMADEFGFRRAALRSHARQGVSLVGFTMPKESQDKLWRKYGETSEGNTVYVPRRSVKAGKVLAARMSALRGVSVNSAMLAAAGLEGVKDVWGPIGSGWGVHYASATLVEGDDTCVAVSLPLKDVDEPVPAALAGAVELTEHQYAKLVVERRRTA